YDSTDQKNLMKQVLKELNVDEKESSMLAFVSRAKNMMVSAAEALGAADNFHDKRLAQVYDAYQKKLRSNNAVDFDDLLMLTLELLTKNPEMREKYQDKFDYILVDEYQDTNRVQYKLTKLLAAKHQNICVVGDADQSIYGWRGADIRNILDFEKDYPDAQLVKLEQNYRSTQFILDAANAVIENNTGRKKKDLWTDKGNGSKPIYYEASDEKDEARFIVERMQELQRRENLSLGNMAVLYRTNAQSRVIEEMLVKSGMSYSLVGGTKFYDRMEIKDILAYLKVIHNPNDSLSLLRIINVPKRGIGNATIEKLQNYGNENGMTLFEVLSAADDVPGLSARFKGKLDELSSIVFELMGEAEEAPMKQLVADVLEKTGYLAQLQASNDPQDESRVENLEELLSVAEDFAKSGEEDNLTNFLEHVSLASDIDNAELKGESVTLMTLHSAKGLEFPVVFLVGMDQGVFPTSRAMYNDVQMEEERRLCYVGITRAEKYLYLTHAKVRMLYGETQAYRASTFMSEIPDKLLDVYYKPGAQRVGQRAVRVETQVQKAQRPAGNWFVGAHTSFVPKENSTSVKFAVSDRVAHSKFGEGIVVAVKDVPNGQEVKVAFPGAGVRSLMTQYAILKKL
ncbi:MAG: UvrD-helicase domain-containing protein, partial [Phascolarctobacterium sp.]|nr:UvrD-helicase domain-containing protein [Phascolarctobacterium sp.]